MEEGAGAEPSPAGARPKKKNRKMYDLTAADKFWQKHKGRSVHVEERFSQWLVQQQEINSSSSAAKKTKKRILVCRTIMLISLSVSLLKVLQYLRSDRPSETQRIFIHLQKQPDDFTDFQSSCSIDFLSMNRLFN